MIKSTGEMGFDEADFRNVPVNIFISEANGGVEGYQLWADNFMPRKASIASHQYKYSADTKAELIELVNKFVVPIYETALKKLKAYGELYYWDEKEKE